MARFFFLLGADGIRKIHSTFDFVQLAHGCLFNVSVDVRAAHRLNDGESYCLSHFTFLSTVSLVLAHRGLGAAPVTQGRNEEDYYTRVTEKCITFFATCCRLCRIWYLQHRRHENAFCGFSALTGEGECGFDGGVSSGESMLSTLRMAMLLNNGPCDHEGVRDY